MTIKWMSSVAVAAMVAGTMTAVAQMPIEGPVVTHATVRVESKNGAELQPGGLKVEVEGRTAEVISVRRVVPAKAQIAILIDEGLRVSFGNQITDVQRFIRTLPAGASVFVGYMRNGSIVSEASGFTTEHETAARQVRLPMTTPGASASPYFCLSDFVKKWPSADRAPRFVLMLTNGVDPYNGSVSPMNQNSPYVDDAQKDAQRAGVAVYSIYFGDAGIRGGAAAFSGQSYLSQIGDATGGRSLWNGVGNPVSLRPFLEDFQKAINESYVVSFNVNAKASRDRRQELARVKISSTQRGVKAYGPDAVQAGW